MENKENTNAYTASTSSSTYLNYISSTPKIKENLSIPNTAKRKKDKSNTLNFSSLDRPIEISKTLSNNSISYRAKSFWNRLSTKKSVNFSSLNPPSITKVDTLSNKMNNLNILEAHLTNNNDNVEYISDTELLSNYHNTHTQFINPVKDVDKTNKYNSLSHSPLNNEFNTTNNDSSQSSAIYSKSNLNPSIISEDNSMTEVNLNDIKTNTDISYKKESLGLKIRKIGSEGMLYQKMKNISNLKKNSLPKKEKGKTKNEKSNLSYMDTSTDSSASNIFKENLELSLSNSISTVSLRNKFNRSYSKNSIKITESTVTAQNFEFLKILGKGDVGRVYLVKNKKSEKLYAMKVLNKKDMIKRNKIKRALAEQEILSSSNHPFIITLYHSFQSGERLFLCMEYCAGGEFFRALQALPNKCLSEIDAKFYVAEVTCDFDLSKPTYPKSLPKISKATSTFSLKSIAPMVNTNTCTTHFRTNSFVGTEEYIAPEVIKGVGHTSAVDWWTLGVLLFEMLYSTTPFKGKSRAQTFNKIVESDVKFPTTPLGLSLSTHCKHLIRKLLHKNEKKRLGSKSGAPDIKFHPFFKDINFALLRHTTPPIIPSNEFPKISSTLSNEFKKDLQQLIEEIFNEGQISYKEDNSENSLENHDPFKEFSSVSLFHDDQED